MFESFNLPQVVRILGLPGLLINDKKCTCPSAYMKILKILVVLAKELVSTFCAKVLRKSEQNCCYARQFLVDELYPLFEKCALWMFFFFGASIFDQYARLHLRAPIFPRVWCTFTAENFL